MVFKMSLMAGGKVKMMAAAAGHLEVAKALLAKGADVNAKSPSGITALQLALTEG